MFDYVYFKVELVYFVWKKDTKQSACWHVFVHECVVECTCVCLFSAGRLSKCLCNSKNTSGNTNQCERTIDTFTYTLYIDIVLPLYKSHYIKYRYIIPHWLVLKYRKLCCPFVNCLQCWWQWTRLWFAFSWSFYSMLIGFETLHFHCFAMYIIMYIYSQV